MPTPFTTCHTSPSSRTSGSRIKPSLSSISDWRCTCCGKLLGQFREALGYYRQALAISGRLKSATSMSQDNGNVALCLLGLGDTEEAIQHFDRAIDLAKQAGMRQDQAYWMRQKGNGLIRQGHYDRGLASHRAALAVYEDLGAQPELAEALHDTGDLYLLLSKTDA